MLSVQCCRSRCMQRNGLPLDCFDFEYLALHNTEWNCLRRQSPQRREEATAPSDDDTFYQLFRRLPHEMKLECLSHCQFHVLANPELWLRDVDRVHFNRMMRNPHVAESTEVSRHSQSILGFAKNRIALSILLPTDNTVLSAVPCRMTRSRDGLDKRFGAVNRYPCFYYRKCSHFNRLEYKPRPSTTRNDYSERWSRLHRLLARDKPIDEEISHILKQAQPLYQSYIYNSVNTETLKSAYPCDKRIDTALDPGMYYWEFINYDWERILNAIEGIQSRQEHFFIDPSDTSHTVPGEQMRKRVCFSLILRRVCHPDSEINDRFTTIGYFHGGRPKLDDESEEWKNVFVNITENGSESGDEHGRIEAEVVTLTKDTVLDLRSCLYEHQMVYGQIHTRMFQISVKRLVDKDRERDVKCYHILFPARVNLHSIDRNTNTIRLNFYVDVADMTDKDKTAFGSSLVKAVKCNIEGTYRFISPTDLLTVFHMTQVPRDIFSFFYE